jgi:hypothetical protein
MVEYYLNVHKPHQNFLNKHDGASVSRYGLVSLVFKYYHLVGEQSEGYPQFVVFA